MHLTDFPILIFACPTNNIFFSFYEKYKIGFRFIGTKVRNDLQQSTMTYNDPTTIYNDPTMTYNDPTMIYNDPTTIYIATLQRST